MIERTLKLVMSFRTPFPGGSPNFRAILQIRDATLKRVIVSRALFAPDCAWANTVFYEELSQWKLAI